MDTWWIKFNLKLVFSELLSRSPLLNRLPLPQVKNFKHTYNLIKGRADWLTDITAPSVFVFEDLDYLLQVPVTLDEIMFENKYPPEIRPYLKRLLEIMISFGYVKKNNDRYILIKPILLEFTHEYQKFADYELKSTPSGREHVLLHDIYSWQKRFKSSYNLAIRRLRSIPNLFTFTNFILSFMKGTNIKSVGFAGGYVLPLIPLLNHFSSARVTYFEHNSLVSNRLKKLVNSVSPASSSRLDIIKKNIFTEEINLEQKHTKDVLFFSSTYVLESEVSLDMLSRNIADLLADSGFIVFDDFILFSENENPYLLASKDTPFFYHYLKKTELTKALRKIGFSKIRFFFPNKKIGAYRGCIVKK